MRAAEPLRRPRSPGEIFRVFNRLALQGFGGVLPVAQHHLVERERWLGKEEFVELLSIGQVLPGPNIVNLALMFGDRFFGWRGALAALAGMLLVPMALVLAAASLYARFAAVPAVAGALRGMGAVAAGLVLATALLSDTGWWLWPTNPVTDGVCRTAAQDSSVRSIRTST